MRLAGGVGARTAALAPLRGFVLPGGTPAAAHAHLARTVARRAERSVVALAAAEPLNPEAVPTGAQDVDGVSWVVYEPGEGEPIWTTRLDGAGRSDREAGQAQIAITGAGSQEDFRTLAKAVQSQAPLPV